MHKRKSILLVFSIIISLICFVGTSEAAKGGGGCKDKDNDGYFQKAGCGTEVDCDDANASVNPGAAEVCDSIDNNCDGTIDEGCGGCTDNDGDGYGNGPDCLGSDCDDTDPNTYPGASLLCDAQDNDCDGLQDFPTDEDKDNDGVPWCAGDCDDNNPDRSPDLTEGPFGDPTCADGLDNDCDNLADGDDFDCACTDNDLDGYGNGPFCLGPDCDDNDAGVNPGSSEICDDNVDNNCDGIIDEDCGGCVPTANKERDCDCFDNADNDCDGSTDSSDKDCRNQTCETCFDDDTDGWYTCGGDCNDTDPAINPGAQEICNGIDDDCDGLLPPEEQDADGDGVSICEGDCDDFNPNKSPNNTEEPFGSPVCNDSIDNDCDTLIDDGDPGCANPCIDNDGDGYGANGNPYCPYFGIDCNDNDPAIHPEAMEVPYDGIDQDCNGSDLTDVDRDGYDAELAGGIDCNDINSLIYPGATEGPYGDLTCCDTADNNCDGQADSLDPGCQDGTGQAAKCEYKIIDLGTLGGDSSYARSINENGQVTGYSMILNGDIRAFLYEDGIMTDLGTLEGRRTEAYDINNSGQVVGYSEVNKGPFVYGPLAFLFENGTMTDIGTLHAFGINDSGQIVGSDSYHGYIFENGVASDLGTLGGDYSTAYDINNSSQIVGYSNLVDGGDYHAFLYEGGIMTDLGTLGGSDSWAHSINDIGQIVGYSNDPNGYTHAFLYENATMTDIGTLGGHLSSAHDINNNGQIVGQSYNGVYTHAFVYKSGIMTDLGTLGGRYSRAEGINDKGLITGYAYIGDSERHAVIWAPDADNDGYYTDEDCDDTDPSVNPGVAEICGNGIDDDCDGFIDSVDSDCIDAADVPHNSALYPALFTDCLECHDESDPNTYTVGARIPSSKCLACHDGITATEADTHASGSIDCVDCHNPMRAQPGNPFHIRLSIASFDGTDYIHGPPTYDGICETCHTQTLHHQNDGIAPGGQSHNDGTACTACHTHPGGPGAGDGFTIDTVPYTDDPHNEWANPGLFPTCTVCHVANDDFVTTVPSSKCLACHDGMIATEADTHASGIIECIDCHNPMYPQGTNAFHIRTTLASFTGADYLHGPPNYDGICETCHTQTLHHRNDGTAPGGQSHNDGTACTACHTHPGVPGAGDGFIAGS